MPVSFLDLPVELMTHVISFVDNVPTVAAMLSIKKVRYQLANHVKIVLDYHGKQPKMFPFHDVCEVIRPASLVDKSPVLIYLIEMDMSEVSFHSEKFYPDDDGVYSALKTTLSRYTRPNSFLCLSVADPLSPWQEDLQMFNVGPKFAEIFDPLHFQAVHIVPSGQPMRPEVYRHNKKITFGEVLGKGLDDFLHSGTRSNATVSLKCPSPAVLDEFMRTSGTCPQFEVSTNPDPSWTVPTGNILAMNKYTWALKNHLFENFRCASMGLLHSFDNVRIEMAKDAPEPDFLHSLNIDDFQWQLTIQMANSKHFKPESTGFSPVPAMKTLSSAKLGSLAIETHNQLPNLHDLDLPNLSALSLRYHDSKLEDLFGFITFETFRTSRIQYLNIVDLALLQKCFFMTNLTRLDGLLLRDDQELKDFKSLKFPHLQILKVESLNVPDTKAPKLRGLYWICRGTAQIKDIPAAFPNLEELEVHAHYWDSYWKAKINGYFFSELKVFTFDRLPPTSEIHYNASSTTATIEETAPTLKKFIYLNDIHAGLRFELRGLEVLESIVLGNSQGMLAANCPQLKMISAVGEKCSTQALKLSAGLPSIQFVTYKSDAKRHELNEDIKHPVFFKRIDGQGKKFYYVWEKEEREQQEDSPGESEVTFVDHEYHSMEKVLIEKYAGEVDGLEAWIREES